jgi:hypothetical protein
MKPIWFFEKDVFEEGIDEIVNAVVDQGMEYKFTDYIPFGDGKYANTFDPKQCVVFYGSLNLGTQLKREVPWVPGVYCDLPKFECTYYYPRLNQFLLNKDCVMLPFGSLLQSKENLFKWVGNNNSLFIRPSNGYKTFTGKVCNYETFEKDVEFLSFYDVPLETIAVVAEPVNILTEWRLVVVDSKIVACSTYRHERKKDTKEQWPMDVLEFAQNVVDHWQPESAWVLDVCRTKDLSLHVVEINSFSCSGLYACNKAAVVKAASALAIKEWNEIYEMCQT